MPGQAQDGPVLVINAGSSSIRFAVFDAGLVTLAQGIASDIGGSDAVLEVKGAPEVRQPLVDHAAALGAILTALAARGLGPEAMSAAGHRVVHGGAALTSSRRLNAGVRAQIAACSPLAPLHNPHNLAAIDALSALRPDLPQVACFDTAFHAGNPEVAVRYALPDRAETQDLRRYGFHGLSYANVVDALPRLSGAALPRRVLAAHLGNGASLCAILDGASVATTMGYSPLEGLTMGTRTGGIDGNAVLALAERMGIGETRHLLNRESGLTGLSGGTSDMRRLLADPDPQADFAVRHFCYWAVRHAGSMIAAMGGCDAVVFTGGIGENAAPVRARIIDGLGWLGARLESAANQAGEGRLAAADSGIGIWVVPAQEERMIAQEVRRLIATT